jgi:hypothetical protein
VSGGRPKEPKSVGRTYKGEVIKPRAKRSRRAAKAMREMRRSATHRARQEAKQALSQEEHT